MMTGEILPGLWPLRADWRDWEDDVTHRAKADESKGDAMAAADASLVSCAGYLLRQGSVLSFNYHR